VVLTLALGSGANTAIFTLLDPGTSATASRGSTSTRPLVASAPAPAEAIVIHEVLHTLGLEENPRTSDDITTAVERRCRATVATRARGAR